MRRYQFEKLIHGDWNEINNGRQRENGDFKTYVIKPWKYISNGKLAFRAKSWKEIAQKLKLIAVKKKAVGKDASNDKSRSYITKRDKPIAFYNRKDRG